MKKSSVTTQRAAQVILILGILFLAFYWYPEKWPASRLFSDLYANLATSLLSISLTVLLIDRLYEQRDQLQLRKRLVWEMGSQDQALAARAVKELRDAAWLSDGSLVGVDLALANLAQLDLSGAHLSDCNMKGANISGADLRQAQLNNSSLDECIAERANFKNSQLQGTSLRRAKLSGAMLEDLDLSGGIDFLRASCIRTSLRGAILKDAKLEECDFSGCDISNADLTNASLLRANMHEANLSGASLERANLEDIQQWERIASIRGARISGMKNAPEGFREWAIQNGAIE